jgi:hypothetical protein
MEATRALEVLRELQRPDRSHLCEVDPARAATVDRFPRIGEVRDPVEDLDAELDGAGVVSVLRDPEVNPVPARIRRALRNADDVPVLRVGVNELVRAVQRLARGSRPGARRLSLRSATAD